MAPARGVDSRYADLADGHIVFVPAIRSQREAGCPGVSGVGEESVEEGSARKAVVNSPKATQCIDRSAQGPVHFHNVLVVLAPDCVSTTTRIGSGT